jgi:hypothetical protein
MSMEMLVAILGLWFIVGVLAAAVFGRLVQGASGAEDTADELTPSTLRYLRPNRRHSNISARDASAKNTRRTAAQR